MDCYSLSADPKHVGVDVEVIFKTEMHFTETCTLNFLEKEARIDIVLDQYGVKDLK